MMTSRHDNRRDAITGALVCRADIYLQMIEGPEDSIDALYARIVRDDRHSHVHLLWSSRIAERMFAGWAMLDEPASPWNWWAAQAASDAMVGEPPSSLHWAFERIAAEVSGQAAEPVA